MPNDPTWTDEFTPEEQARIQAHVRARGMTFEVFLPQSLANWLRTQLADGVFADAKEAAFLAFQDLQQLDEHPHVREQLQRAVIEERLNDPRPGIPAEQVVQQQRARWRRWAETEPPAAADPVSSPTTNASLWPTRMRITVERYQKMVATGVLSSEDRVELIEGDIVNRAPPSPRHAQLRARLAKRLILGVGEAALVGPGNPVDLGADSELEPDLVLLKRRPDDYCEAHPQADDVLLLVEVADASLAFDLGAKRDLYARFGVCEYWVVDVIHERLLVNRQPVDGRFRETYEYGLGDTLSPEALPSFSLAVRDLFGTAEELQQ